MEALAFSTTISERLQVEYLPFNKLEKNFSYGNMIATHYEVYKNWKMGKDIL